jgi:ATP-dependent DNA ligase
MESVIDILESLESDNSRLFKEEVLRRNTNKKLLKEVFVAVGDPYTNFYVSKFKAPKPLSTSTTSDDGAVMAFLDLLNNDLATRNLTGNAAKAAVESFFTGLDARQAKWCTRILLRNLRVGASESLVEKTWPGAIAKFSVQLAESLESRHEAGKGIVIAEPVAYPVRVEPKLDGLRCIAIKRNGEVTMFTRSGSPIETLPTIKEALEAAPWDDFVLDGEAMGKDWNESASVVMSHKTAKDDSGIVYNVFDAMVFDDWHDQNNESPLEDRVELVKELVAQVASEHVAQVGGITVKDQDALMKFYGKAIEGGFEGIMVKKLGSPYIFKRSDSVMKLKPVSTYEGVIVGHYEGNRGSKREGLWGGFLVVMPNGVVTKVGGGYNDKIRAEISIDPDSWIGKIVEVEGQPDPLTPDGLTADGKVRFPVFCRVRDPRDVDPKVIAAGEAYLDGMQ